MLAQRLLIAVLARLGSCTASGLRSLDQAITRSSWRVLHGRYFLNSSQARVPSPLDLRGINGQREVWPAFEQGLERASAFDAGELVTETEVDARAKRDMPVRPPIEVESLGP